jgi:hypothetical protein
MDPKLLIITCIITGHGSRIGLLINSLIFILLGSHDSSVGIALSYGLDNQGSRVQFLAGDGNFSLCHHIQNSSGAHPPSSPMGTGGGKQPGREADHSPPSLVLRSRMCGAIPPLPQYTTVWCLVKHGDNFIFILLKCLK